MNSVHDHPKADERRTPNVYRTVDDLAVELGLSRQVVYRELRAGRIPSIRLGRRFVIPRAAVEEWLRNAAGNLRINACLAHPR